MSIPDPDRPAAGHAAAHAATGRRMSRAALILGVLLAVGFALTFMSRWHHEHVLRHDGVALAAEPSAIDTMIVGAAPPTASLSLPGQTAAWYDSTIYARVDGYVASWTANIGDRVRKDQILATIETPDLDAQLTAAKAKLRAAQAAVAFTASTYKRWKDSPPGVVSDQEREAKKADYDNAVAQAGLNQAEVDRYAALTAFRNVTAPYDGTITARSIDIGNLVTANSTSTTPLYRMVDDDPMRVFVAVPQDAATAMRPGVAATVTPRGHDGQPLAGKIARTADAIDPATRTLQVEIDLPNPDHRLVSGMYVDVGFALDTGGLPQVPPAAVLFRAGGPMVAVIGADNRIAFRKVVIARDSGTMMEIAAGLSAGDRVALNLGSQVTEGAEVRPQAANDTGANPPSALHPAPQEDSHAQSTH